MIMKVYSVFDKKACVYSAPFFQLNDGVALRSFIDLVNDKRSSVYQHAEDYVLDCIGSFEDDTALLVAVKPLTICTAISVQEPKEDPRQTTMFPPAIAPPVKTVPLNGNKKARRRAVKK